MVGGQGDRDGEDLGDAVRRTLAEEEDGAGVLVLTPQMRGGGGRLGAPLPDVLPPAEDEEPPLLLTERIDGGGASAAPEPTAWSPAPDPAPAPEVPAWAPAPQPGDAPPAPEAPAWGVPPEAPAWGAAAEPRSDDAAEERPAGVSPEPPAWSSGAPAPTSFAQPPAWALTPEPAPPVEDAGQDAQTPPPFPGDPAQPAFQPEPEAETPAGSVDSEPAADAEVPPRAQSLRADDPRSGSLRPVAADPEVEREGAGASSRELREAFSSATPGPLAATGLPRNRDELVEIVRQSIREELAGPLGERISANIRALIEREVARALAERDRDGDA